MHVTQDMQHRGRGVGSPRRHASVDLEAFWLSVSLGFAVRNPRAVWVVELRSMLGAWMQEEPDGSARLRRSCR